MTDRPLKQPDPAQAAKYPDGGGLFTRCAEVHCAPRYASSAHILLGHPFTFPIDGSGSRNIDRELEEEANWLGPTILVSDEAALHIVQNELPTDTACMHYKVTEPVLRMRINASVAMIRKKRSSH
jgi:hypothetical protein